MALADRAEVLTDVTIDIGSRHIADRLQLNQTADSLVGQIADSLVGTVC